jgi:hypothetical protein
MLSKKESAMKLETAIKVLLKECEFLGENLAELLQDIAQHGRMIYSEKVVQAAEVYNSRG